MRRAIPRVVPYGSSETSKWVIEGLRVDGKRVRKFFPTQRKAAAWLRKTLARSHNEGSASAILMPEALRVEATTLEARLKPYGATLTEAVEHYIAHREAVQGSRTVSELIPVFLQQKKADKKRDRYLADLKHRLERFEQEFGARPVAEIRRREIKEWINGLGLATQTKRNFRTVLSTFFAYAVENEFASENRVEGIDVGTIDRAEPATFTPAQLRILLEKASRDVLPWLLLGAFAGLRSAEIERLDWSEIDVAERLVKLSADKAKTRRKRNVRISDNLAAWLQPLKKEAGPVAHSERIRDAREALTKELKLKEWPSNALRHSYGSYHLAQHKDSPRTAYEMGHTSPKMLYAHYDGVATPAAAAEWWGIMPPADYSNVVAFEKEAANA